MEYQTKHILTCEEAKLRVGKGWHSLLDKLYHLLPQTGYVTDIKEKFGGLRIEAGGCDLETIEQIEQIEEESFSHCEICGRLGRQIEPKNGWIKTRCDEHQEEG